MLKQHRRRRRARGSKTNGVNGAATGGVGTLSASTGSKSRHNSPVILSKTQEMVKINFKKFY
jgi:hypothetical protein